MPKTLKGNELTGEVRADCADSHVNGLVGPIPHPCIGRQNRSLPCFPEYGKPCMDNEWCLFSMDCVRRKARASRASDAPGHAEARRETRHSKKET